MSNERKTYLKEGVPPDGRVAHLELVVRAPTLFLERVDAVWETTRQSERLALRDRERGACVYKRIFRHIPNIMNAR